MRAAGPVGATVEVVHSDEQLRVRRVGRALGQVWQAALQEFFDTAPRSTARRGSSC
ncbi:MAG: hypothetical protein L0H64_07510 [Pseudonocardia sp.]|nr:hypothetical protein [Pseudonocardia sp.]